jgi:hypothetical protein
VPTGRIEYVEKEVLAKSVGDTASFLQFLGIQKYLFGESASLLHGGVHSIDRKKL